MRFRSKIDLWAGIVLVSVPAVALAAAIATTFTDEVAAAALAWATLLGVIALYWLLIWPVFYELAPDALVVRFGRCRTRIPYEEITRVRPTRNPLSSPALSLSRLQIDRRGHRFAVVSPDDRAGFLRALEARAPHVVID